MAHNEQGARLDPGATQFECTVSIGRCINIKL